MEMQQIRYFLALCEERNFTRAARRCGVAQPSLTRAIKQLEAEFGGPLFERNRRTSPLSDLGKHLQPHLAVIDRSAADAKREAARFLATHDIPTPNVQERSMRKIVYGAAIAAGVLLVAVMVIRQPPRATASQINASDTINVRALMSTINVKALPKQDTPSEVYE